MAGGARAPMGGVSTMWTGGVGRNGGGGGLMSETGAGASPITTTGIGGASVAIAGAGPASVAPASDKAVARRAMARTGGRVTHSTARMAAPAPLA